MSLKEELSLVTKLKSLGVPVGTVFSGDTYRSDRLAKIRSAIITNGLADIVFSDRDSRLIYMRDQFWLAYGEDLYDSGQA